MARNKKYVFVYEKDQKNNGGLLIIILCFVLSIAIVAITVSAYMNTKVKLLNEKITFLGMSKELDGFSILHISDLHASKLGSDFTVWRNTLNQQKYHAVVLTGDMVGKSGESEAFLSLIHNLKQINSKIPIYFIAGDEDPAPIISTYTGSPETIASWVTSGEKAGAIYLDVPVCQQVGDEKVWFIPEYLYDVDINGMIGSLSSQILEMEKDGYPYESSSASVYNASKYRLDTLEYTQNILANLEADDFQVAVNHAPLDISYIRSSLSWSDKQEIFTFKNIDLMLAGHYCGGQWRIPLLSSVYMPEFGWFPPDEGIVGFRRVNSLNLYISPGLSARTTHPLMGRLFNPPAVTILRFSRSL